MTGTINKDLIRYILQLEESQQEELLNYAKQLLEKNAMLSRAKASLEDYKAGRVVSFEEFEKEARAWLKEKRAIG